jgi:hypothetical protein
MSRTPKTFYSARVRKTEHRLLNPLRHLGFVLRNITTLAQVFRKTEQRSPHEVLFLRALPGFDHGNPPEHRSFSLDYCFYLLKYLLYQSFYDWLFFKKG